MGFIPLCVAITLVVVAGFNLRASANPLEADEGAPEEKALPPIGHTDFCRDNPGDCARREPSSLFGLLAESALYENLDAVNRWVNSAIVPAHEASPENIGSKWFVLPYSGNCHDFAVSKRHELLKMGWPSSALLLAEVELKTGERHLVLVASLRGRKFVLDNLSPTVLPVQDVRDYSWIRMESARFARYWVKASAL